MNPRDDPFRQPRSQARLSRSMAMAPALEPQARTGPVERRLALLVNPFYPKSPHGSFGKHVLTPSLSLTSVAGATPGNWRVRYWDENLLQGAPPADPLPEVVGLTVHLTFAARAYELAAWFRARGSRVVLGGMHVNTSPGEALPHADAISVGDGVRTWPRILRDVERDRLQPRYDAPFGRNYDSDPPPRRDLVPRHAFLTTTSVIASRGCRNRCSFCYLATDGVRMPYAVRAPEDVARLRTGRLVPGQGQPHRARRHARQHRSRRGPAAR